MNTLSHTYNTEYIKERIYGSITLLAANIGLLSHIEDFSALQITITLIMTAAGLWLASIFAEIMASQIVRNHNEICHTHYKEIFVNSLGILQSATFPVLMSVLAIFGIIPIRGAVLAAIILASMQIFAIILFVTLKRENNIFWNIGLIIAQILVFLLIITLKLGH